MNFKISSQFNMKKAKPARFLRSVEVEEIKGMSFPLTTKIKTESNSELPKNSTCFRKIKEAKNSEEKNIFHDNIFSKSNKKGSEHFVLKPEFESPEVKTESTKTTFDSNVNNTLPENYAITKRRSERIGRRLNVDASKEKHVLIPNKKEILKLPTVKLEKTEIEPNINLSENKEIIIDIDIVKSKQKLDNTSTTLEILSEKEDLEVSKIKENESVFKIGKQIKEKKEIRDKFKKKADVLKENSICPKEVDEAAECSLEIESCSNTTAEKDLKQNIERTTKKKTKSDILFDELISKGNKLSSNVKESTSNECNETEFPLDMNTNSNVSTENVFSHNVEETNEKADKIITDKIENELLNNDAEYKAFSNYFDVTIPLIGKRKFPNINDKPFTKRYDLAIERNKRRFLYMKKTGMDDEIFKLIEEEKRMASTDGEKYDMMKKRKHIYMACYVTELCSKILKGLRRDVINESKIVRYFEKFLLARVTPTCLLYIPHFIHTISFIRGNKQFSKVLRLVANECYDKCHAMFPIPAGYNFETMYTSEMTKFLPDDFHKMKDIPLDYGDIDDLLEWSCFNDDSNNNFDNSEADE